MAPDPAQALRDAIGLVTLRMIGGGDVDAEASYATTIVQEGGSEAVGAMTAAFVDLTEALLRLLGERGVDPLEVLQGMAERADETV